MNSSSSNERSRMRSTCSSLRENALHALGKYELVAGLALIKNEEEERRHKMNSKRRTILMNRGFLVCICGK